MSDHKLNENVAIGQRAVKMSHWIHGAKTIIPWVNQDAWQYITIGMCILNARVIIQHSLLFGNILL